MEKSGEGPIKPRSLLRLLDTIHVTLRGNNGRSTFFFFDFWERLSFERKGPQKSRSLSSSFPSLKPPSSSLHSSQQHNMSTRVYLGHLSRDASDRDVENLFKSYGRIREVTLKNGFGFVEFSDIKDAEDAVYDYHGKDFMGER